MSLQKGIVLLSVAAVGLIVIASVLVQKRIEAETVKEVEQSIRTVLDTTHQAMHSWMSQHKPLALAWANSTEIRHATQALLGTSDSRASLMTHEAQTGLRSWLRPVLQANGYWGYALIAPSGVTLAASYEDELGSENRLPAASEFLNRIFAGGATFSPPQTNDDSAPDAERKPHRPEASMFVGAPVQDDAGNVVAALVFRLDPSEGFAPILQQGRIGVSGETYLFDNAGHLISESRFKEQLRETGLLSADQPAALSIELRDPGVDLTSGKRQQTPTLEAPLTLMARQAIAGNSGTNMEGYRDYRGVIVVGAWMWDRELGFGIATELDRDEAYRALDFSLKAISVLTIFCSVLVMGLTAIYLLGRRLAVAAEKRLRESEQFAHSVLRSLPAHIAVLDAQGEIRAVNSAWRLFARENGNPERDATGVGVNYLDVCRRAEGQSSGEAPLALAGIQSVIDGEAPGFTLEYPCHAPGQQRWFLLSVSNFADGQKGAVVSHLDITERKQAEVELMRHRSELEQLVRERNRELYLSEQNLRSMVESALGLILWLSPKGQIVGFNREAERLYGKKQAEMIGKSYVDTLVPATERKAMNAIIDKALMGHPMRNFEHSIEAHDGYERTLIWNLDRILGPDGEPTGIIAVGLDITSTKEAEQRLQHLAHFDQLTGLPNRMLFHDCLRAALARARRHGKQVAVLFMDLDSFKQVNDTMGHQSGDELLAATAERLKLCVRREDTVARLGGDEFAAILDDLDDTELAHSLTKRMLEVLQTEITFAGTKLRVSGSIGVAVYPVDGDDEETILRHADHAMYYAKQSGKSGYRFFDPEMNARLVDRVRLESCLRGAIGTKQLFVQYQPKFDLGKGRVVGAEALARWNHPDMGIVPPARFIPVAEETGMIIPLGRFVMEQACQAARSWQLERGLDLPVAVNLSARQFRHERIVEDVKSALAETGLPSDMLELELTESLLMEDIDRTLAVLDVLKSMGVRIAMDDFGSAYSSLSYLKKLPVDVVKIDRSFVRDIPADDDDRTIVSAIISLAHSLNHKVIAEGVEKAEQVQFLKGKSCDEIQGFYISPPVFPEDLASTIGTIENFRLEGRLGSLPV